MFIAKEIGRVNGIPIYEYKRDDERYLVREFGTPCNEGHNYYVESPSGKLYCFCQHKGSIEELLLFIKQGKADCDKYLCELKSIFDE